MVVADSYKTKMERVESFLHALPCEAWLVYHVKLKAIQCASVAGIGCYLLNAPLLIRSPWSLQGISSPERALTGQQLRRHLFQTFVLGMAVALGVVGYNLVNLEHDILEDRVYRIIGSQSQKQIDYSSIIGGVMGLLHGVAKAMDEGDIGYDYGRIMEYVVCNGLIGVGAGVMFHILRTRNYVAPSRILRYTLQCWS